LGAEDQGGVGVEEAGAEAGFSLGAAGENNRPPEDDEGMEETHSPKEAGEPQTMAPKAEKQELFVTFKERTEQGREIESRFKQLKADLKDAKGTLSKLAQEVNAHKRDIDGAQLELDRVTAGGGGADASGIIDNDEWEAQKKLREKKKAYREKFDQHTQQRRMIEDFEAKIKQTKVELVGAFEGWWQQNYGSTQRDGDAGGVLDDLQDIGEQFDSMELDRMERIHPTGAVPFFKARKEFRLHHGTRTLRQ
jgi:DNA repair exonuclease SbcCD ATPase subunit